MIGQPGRPLGDEHHHHHRHHYHFHHHYIIFNNVIIIIAITSMIRQPGKPLGEEHNCHHQCQKKNYHRHCHEVKMVLLRIFRCMTLLHTGDGDGAAMAVAQVAHCSAIFLCYLVGLQWLWPRQLSFSLYRSVLQVKWPLKQLKYLRIFIVTKFLFVKKLAIYSCFFWLNEIIKCSSIFLLFPFHLDMQATIESLRERLKQKESTLTR